MTGTRISDMVPLTTLPASGALVPIVEAGLGINYLYDLASGLAAVAATPEDYAAVGGGVVNDTAAVQAVINSGAKWIYLAGTYAVTAVVLNQLSGVTIFGPGTLKMTGTPVNGTHALSLIQCDRVTIDGITIHGQSESRGGVAGSNNLSMYGCTNCVLRNVKSLYSAGDGFYLNRAGAGTVINGITMGDAVSSNIRVENCIFDNAYRNGQTVVACEGALFANCVFSNTGKSLAGTAAPSAGVDLEPNDTVQYFPKRTLFQGCRWYNNTGAHLIVNGRCYETTVDNGHFEVGTSYGISNAGARTIVRNTLVKDTGASSRPSINNASQTGSRASLTLENVEITGALQGGVTHNSYADLTVRNLKVSDGANYGLRLAVGSDPGDANKGFCDVDGARLEKLFSSSPPSNSAYVMPGNYNGRLKLRGVRLLRTGATGTPIEIGADLSLAPPTDIQEISDFNAIGTFASGATGGFSTSRILRNNRLNDVVSDALTIAAATTFGGGMTSTSGSFSTTLAVTGASSLNGGMTSTSGAFSTTLTVTGAAALNGGMTSTTGAFSTSVAIGSGTALTKAVVYTPSITPSAVSAATVAEQTFNVPGLTTADKVIVNPPAIANATGIAGARVSAADTLAIRFVNPTAGSLTPTSGTYPVLAFRS